ncbi:MAG: universal stress protein [Thermoplasmata archaeon]|nr:universal stress protein [Thermoplasmata archaeon]
MHRTDWDPSMPFRKILVTVDGSPGALQAAAYVSKLFRSADFHLVGCLNTARGDIMPSTMLLRILEDQMRKGLDECSAILRKAGIEPKVSLLSGDPATRVLRYISSNGIDLIVLRRKFEQTLPSPRLGKVGDVLASRALCPVLIVKGDPEPTIGKILNPTDGGTDSVPSGRLALALAKHFDARLTKLYVGDDPAAGKVLLSEAEGDARKHGVSSVMRTEIVKGDPSGIILKAIGDHDIIVMGKGIRSFLRRDHLCLTSREIVALSERPVLLVN